MLKINNISKNFAGHKVLENITLEVNKETIVGLAGASGCGKSTLLRLIQGLEKVDSGEINYKGRAGFMFQDFQLFPHFTVLQNLTYAPDVHEKGRDHTKQALNLLHKLSVKDKANMYPHELSGGQKQRVALARSLMMKPDILICDEPTSGLDVATILDIVELLNGVRKGVTMIIASHDLDFLTKTADRILVLSSGKVACDIDVSSLSEPISYLKKFY